MELLRHLLGHGLWALLVLLWPTLSAVITGLVIGSFSQSKEITTTAILLTVLISFAISSAFLLALLYIIKRYFSHVFHYPPQHHRFTILNQEVSYICHDRSLTYTKSKVLKATADDLHYYEDLFRWTGSLRPKLESLIDDQSIDMGEKRTLYQTYRILFNRGLRKGEEVKTALRWVVEDRGDAVPFFSTTIEEPTRLMTFKYHPEGESAARVFFEEKFSLSAKRSFNSIEIYPDTNGDYTYTLKPKLYYYYEMRWIPKGPRAAA